MITDEGLISVLHSLEWHTQLKELYVGNNAITDFGINCLINSLPKFPHLKILGLNSCGVTDDNIINFSHNASTNLASLETLFLSGNDIGDDGAIALSTILS